MNNRNYILDTVFLKFLIRFGFSRTLNIIIKIPFFYNSYIRIIHRLNNSLTTPNLNIENKVLQNVDEYLHYVNYLNELGLFPHSEVSKNWDSFIALNLILREISKAGFILDAGAEKYSTILPWLHLYNYKKLIGINLILRAR